MPVSFTANLSPVFTGLSSFLIGRDQQQRINRGVAIENKRQEISSLVGGFQQGFQVGARRNLQENQQQNALERINLQQGLIQQRQQEAQADRVATAILSRNNHIASLPPPLQIEYHNFQQRIGAINRDPDIDQRDRELMSLPYRRLSQEILDENPPPKRSTIDDMIASGDINIMPEIGTVFFRGKDGSVESRRIASEKSDTFSVKESTAIYNAELDKMTAELGLTASEATPEIREAAVQATVQALKTFQEIRKQFRADSGALEPRGDVRRRKSDADMFINLEAAQQAREGLGAFGGGQGDLNVQQQLAQDQQTLVAISDDIKLTIASIVEAGLDPSNPADLRKLDDQTREQLQLNAEDFFRSAQRLIPQMSNDQKRQFQQQFKDVIAVSTASIEAAGPPVKKKAEPVFDRRPGLNILPGFRGP